MSDEPISSASQPGRAGVPECTSCAACCFGDGERYVPVTGDDHERLGALAAIWTRFVGHRCYMRMVDGHCAALERDPATGRWVCRLYERRPAVCRDLERGSPACDAERLRKQERAAAGPPVTDGAR